MVLKSRICSKTQNQIDLPDSAPWYVSSLRLYWSSLWMTRSSRADVLLRISLKHPTKLLWDCWRKLRILAVSVLSIQQPPAVTATSPHNKVLLFVRIINSFNGDQTLFGRYGRLVVLLLLLLVEAAPFHTQRCLLWLLVRCYKDWAMWNRKPFWQVLRYIHAMIMVPFKKCPQLVNSTSSKL